VAFRCHFFPPSCFSLPSCAPQFSGHPPQCCRVISGFLACESVFAGLSCIFFLAGGFFFPIDPSPIRRFGLILTPILSQLHRLRDEVSRLRVRAPYLPNFVFKLWPIVVFRLCPACGFLVSRFVLPTTVRFIDDVPLSSYPALPPPMTVRHDSSFAPLSLLVREISVFVFWR